MNEEVFLSILAMDSYQRGNAPGILGLPNVAPGISVEIGKATLKLVELPVGSLEAGFSAQTYILDEAWAGLAAGTTVVSYRGTDFDAFNDVISGDSAATTVGKALDSQFARDFFKRWSTFTGLGPRSQFPLAEASPMPA